MKKECRFEEYIPHAIHDVLLVTTVSLAAVMLHKLCRIHKGLKEIRKGREEIREGRDEILGREKRK